MTVADYIHAVWSPPLENSLHIVASRAGYSDRMKLWFPCSHCFNGTSTPMIAGPATMQDSGLAIIDCRRGHQSAVIYDERKYWILMISAANAFVDGHNREGVTSMAAAIERAYEYYVRCSMHAKGLSLDQVEEFWKPLSKLSERQFGAFCALYFLDTKIRFDVPAKHIEFRNRVTHQGYMPSEMEAIEYGRFAFNILKQLTDLIDGFGKDVVKSVQSIYLKKQANDIPDGIPSLTLSGFYVKVEKGTNVGTPVDSFEEFVASFINGQNWMEGFVPPESASGGEA